MQSNMPGLEIVLATSPIGIGAYAGRDIHPGEKLCSVTGAVSTRPTRMSLQIGPSLHIEPDQAAWQYINHSCDPNLAVDFTEWRFAAVRSIVAGEELNWNYLTTEWHLSSPFECRCGAKGCFRTIAGFSALDDAQRALIGTGALHLLAGSRAQARSQLKPRRAAA